MKLFNESSSSSILNTVVTYNFALVGQQKCHIYIQIRMIQVDFDATDRTMFEERTIVSTVLL